MNNTPKSLIINSPYDMPQQHWAQDRQGRVLQVLEGRRKAGYEIVDTRTNTRRNFSISPGNLMGANM